MPWPAPPSEYAVTVPVGTAGVTAYSTGAIPIRAGATVRIITGDAMDGIVSADIEHRTQMRGFACGYYLPNDCTIRLRSEGRSRIRFVAGYLPR